MFSTVVLSNENQTSRGKETVTGNRIKQKTG